MCGLSRMIFPAAMIGLAVSSLSGHPLAGWLAAAVVAAVVYVMGRRSPVRACPAPVRPAGRPSRTVPDRSGGDGSTPGGSCGYRGERST